MGFKTFGHGDTGGASRFFYCAKPSRAERNLGTANNHPTVKPLSLMRYLITLITPQDGLVLDPFMGSGSTLCAAKQLGFPAIGIDMTAEYCKIARCRIDASHKGVFDIESPIKDAPGQKFLFDTMGDNN